MNTRSLATGVMGGLVCLLAPGMVFADEKADGWLGVQLVPTPKALAAHLRLEGPSLMVRNVLVGSPADKAGIEQYDVVAELDGQAVPKTVQVFAEKLRAKGADSGVELKLIRRGEPLQMTLKLASTPAPREFKYKYPDDPETFQRDSLDYRARILRPTPDGGYVLEDLGPVPHVEPFLPLLDAPMWTEKPPPEDHLRRVAPPELRGFWNRDGENMELHVTPDGKIHVTMTKTRKGGRDTETRVYDNAAQLREENPRAYELYEKLHADRSPSFRFRVPKVEDAERRYGDWEKAFRERMEKLEDSARERLERMRRPAGAPADGALKSPATRPSRAARTSAAFSVDATGRITATVRDGDSEMTMQFESEAQMRERYPTLHEKYAAMRDKLR